MIHRLGSPELPVCKLGDIGGLHSCVILTVLYDWCASVSHHAYIALRDLSRTVFEPHHKCPLNLHHVLAPRGTSDSGTCELPLIKAIRVKGPTLWKTHTLATSPLWPDSGAKLFAPIFEPAQLFHVHLKYFARRQHHEALVVRACSCAYMYSNLAYEDTDKIRVEQQNFPLFHAYLDNVA